MLNCVKLLNASYNSWIPKVPSFFRVLICPQNQTLVSSVTSGNGKAPGQKLNLFWGGPGVIWFQSQTSNRPFLGMSKVVSLLIVIIQLVGVCNYQTNKDTTTKSTNTGVSPCLVDIACGQQGPHCTTTPASCPDHKIGEVETKDHIYLDAWQPLRASNFM